MSTERLQKYFLPYLLCQIPRFDTFYCNMESAKLKHKNNKQHFTLKCSKMTISINDIVYSIDTPEYVSASLSAGELTRSGCGYAQCCTWEEWARLWGLAGPPRPSHPPDTLDTSAAAAGTSSAVQEDKERTGPKITKKDISQALCSATFTHTCIYHKHNIYLLSKLHNFITNTHDWIEWLIEIVNCVLYMWWILWKSLSFNNSVNILPTAMTE